MTTPEGTVYSTGAFTYLYPVPSITSFTPSNGYFGTTVTISGNNFVNAANVTQVTFGGTPAASYTVPNASTISATVGAGGSGTVAVTTLSGTATSAGAFTYNYQTPTITSFGPTSGSTGSYVEIQGTNFFGASAVCFGGTPATSFGIVNSGTEIIATLGSGSTGPITVTNPAGTATSSGTFYCMPTITSFTPSSGMTGVTVSITGTNLLGATAGTIGGTAADSFTVNSITTITATVGSGSTGAISVTTPAGTVSSSMNFTYITPQVTGISLSPASLIGGNTSNATITVNTPAPAAGITVALSSSNGSAQVPASVTVTQWNTSANFTVTTSPVGGNVNAVITATLVNAPTATLTILPPGVSSLSLTPSCLTGSANFSGTVGISAPRRRAG